MSRRAFNPVHLLSLSCVLAAVLFTFAVAPPTALAQPQLTTAYRQPSAPKLRRRRGRVDVRKEEGAFFDGAWWDESWPPRLAA
jgi:hypothetical protein